MFGLVPNRMFSGLDNVLVCGPQGGQGHSGPPGDKGIGGEPVSIERRESTSL